MTAPARRTHPVSTLPVFDLRTGDVVVGTDSEIVEIEAETPWTRRIAERHPSGQITRFTYDCADELTVYRRPVVPPPVPTAAVEAVAPHPAALRCPRCASERAFVVQVTVEVVLGGDLDIIEPASSPADHALGPIIDPRDGLRGDESVQCQQDRGGCGHRGSVGQFRVPAEGAARKG